MDPTKGAVSEGPRWVACDPLRTRWRSMANGLLTTQNRHAAPAIKWPRCRQRGSSESSVLMSVPVAPPSALQLRPECVADQEVVNVVVATRHVVQSCPLEAYGTLTLSTPTSYARLAD